MDPGPRGQDPSFCEGEGYRYPTFLIYFFWCLVLKLQTSPKFLGKWMKFQPASSLCPFVFSVNSQSQGRFSYTVSISAKTSQPRLNYLLISCVSFLLYMPIFFGCERASGIGYAASAIPLVHVIIYWIAFYSHDPVGRTYPPHSRLYTLQSHFISSWVVSFVDNVRVVDLFSNPTTPTERELPSFVLWTTPSVMDTSR